MYRPISLTIKDFISHENSTLDFKSGKVTVISGLNLDDIDSGADSNGSGKSSFIEAITYALTGESYKDVNKVDLIRDGFKSSTVTLLLRNDFLKEDFTITRRITKSSAEVVININGQDVKEITGVPEANKFIIEKIGISKEDLLNFFIINQGNYSSFFKNSDTKQKEIISRFIDTKVVNSVIKTLEDEKSVIEKEIASNNANIVKAETNIETLLGLIDEEKNAPKVDKQVLIKPFKDKIEENKASIVALKKSIELKKQSLKALKLELKSGEDLNDEDLNDLRELRGQIENEVNLISSVLSKQKSELRTLKSSLGDKIECPSCKFNFIIDSELSVLEITEKIEKINKKIEDDELNKKATSDEYELVENEIKVSEELLSARKILNKKIKTVESSIEDDNSEISSYEERNVKNSNKIKSILEEEVKLDSKIPEYESKIEVFKEQKIHFEDLNSSKLEILDDKNFWIFHLGKKGFQTFLANKSIKTIESYCNNFMELMGSNLKVVINGYKVLANGDVREKIETTIIRSGETEGSKFDKFSGGQKERVNVSAILTFYTLINNSLSDGKGLDLLCLDECIDNLDSSGQSVVFDMLKVFKATTVIITHSKVENTSDDFNRVTVKMKDKVSKVC
jgi:DNA repair exonuclease SbcCD ATPase subunit